MAEAIFQRDVGIGWDLRLAATKALSGETVFDPQLAQVPGFASRELRFLVSELCLQVPYPRYLEIGLFYGATFAAAMQQKEGRFIGIDSFCEFQGSVMGAMKGTGVDRLEVHALQQRHSIQAIMAVAGKGQALFYEQDHLSVPPELVREKLGGGINVFFYDGNHSAEATAAGINHFAPACDDQFILVVDDYSDPEVVEGTQAALAKIPFTLEDEVLFLRRQSEKDDFNYGVYTAILKRVEL